jgi:GAF domain-containing protein
MTDEPIVAATELADSLEWLSLGAEHWDAERVLREGLDLVLAATGADSCQLFSVGDEIAFEVAARPGPVRSVDAGVPADWFPWGLAAVRPRRFLYIADAAALPVSPDDAAIGSSGAPGSAGTPGSAGSPGSADPAGSALHLPVIERQRVIGALHLRWTRPRPSWDDQLGPLLRLLARYLLAQSLAAQSEDPSRRMALSTADSRGADGADDTRVRSDSMTSWRSR